MTVSEDVAQERERQNAKWGVQNHHNGTGPLQQVLLNFGDLSNDDLRTQIAATLADHAKNATDWRAQLGMVTWADILLEEVFEALAEQDTDALRTELIQVAAVAQQWVEAIDRKKNWSWILREEERARARSAQIPAQAKPIIVDGFLGRKSN